MSSSDSPQSQSQVSNSVGSFSGNDAGSNNTIALGQAGRDANIDQSTTEVAVENSDLQAALEAIRKLKQGVSTTEFLNLVEKKQTEFTIQMLEDEIQKSKPDKNLIDQTVTALKKGLESVTTLAGPVTQVAELVGRAWAGI